MQVLKTGFTDPETGKPTAYELASERNLEGYNYFTKGSVSQFVRHMLNTTSYQQPETPDARLTGRCR
jgi:hypothetical protein